MPFLSTLFISGGVGIILLLAALLLAFKLARRIFPYVLAAAILAVVLSVAFGINVISEARAFAGTFPDAQNLFLLHENSRLAAGFEGRLTSAEALSYLGSDQLQQLQPSVEAHNLMAIRSSYFRVVLVDAQAFAEGQPLEEIRAADTRERLITRLLAEQGAQDTPETRQLMQHSLEQQRITTDHEARGLLFAGLIAQALQEDALFLLAGSAEGTVAIEPETVTFKIAGNIPSFLIKAIE